MIKKMFVFMSILIIFFGIIPNHNLSARNISNETENSIKAKFDKAVKLLFDSYNLVVNSKSNGDSQLGMTKLDDAVGLFAEVRDYNENYPGLNYYMSYVYIMANNIDEAIICQRKELKSTFPKIKVYDSLGALYEQSTKPNKFLKAIEMYENALRYKPNQKMKAELSGRLFRLYNKLAWEKEKIGEYETVLKYYRKAHYYSIDENSKKSIKSNLKGIYLVVVGKYLKAFKYNDAINVIEEANRFLKDEEILKKYCDTLYDYSEILMKENSQLAKTMLDKIKSVKPRYNNLYIGYTKYYLSRNQKQKALEMLNQGLLYTNIESERKVLLENIKVIENSSSNSSTNHGSLCLKLEGQWFFGNIKSLKVKIKGRNTYYFDTRSSGSNYICFGAPYDTYDITIEAYEESGQSGRVHKLKAKVFHKCNVTDVMIHAGSDSIYVNCN
jgi:tetratricopeptide (TPR) repeat protein